MAQDSNGDRESRAVTMNDVRSLARILKQYDLTSLEVEWTGAQVRLTRDRQSAAPAVIEQAASVPPSPVPQAADEATKPAASDDGSVEISSPFVGTFYRAPAPDADPFIREGNEVKKGQVLCIVEAMKLMNEIECEVDGKIVKILIDNGEPVEFGQPLFRLQPAK